MEGLNKYLEPLLIVVFTVAVVYLYVYGGYNQLWATSFITPIVAALFVGLVLRIRLLYIFRDINGRYRNKKDDSIQYQVSFPISNLLRFRPFLVVDQFSNERGSWNASYIVSDFNPFVVRGLFEYLSSGSVVPTDENDWGIHELYIRPNSAFRDRPAEIHVHATALGRSGTNRFVLTKVGKQDHV